MAMTPALVSTVRQKRGRFETMVRIIGFKIKIKGHDGDAIATF